MLRKLPSFSLNGSTPTAAEPPRGRSLSPWRNRNRDDSAEGLRKEGTSDTEDEGTLTHVLPSGTAFNGTDDSEDLSSEDDEDKLLQLNTVANAGFAASSDILTQEPTEMVFSGEGPNLLPPSEIPSLFAKPRRKNTKSSIRTPIVLSRAVFEKNRVTVTVTKGDPASVSSDGRRTRSYVVASDLSDESGFAIEWMVGTVLRDGDSACIVSVVETDVKFDGDPDDAGDRKAKINYQKDRQARALTISRQVTALLERTKLNVAIHCVVIASKNARHELLDQIDLISPTMVLLGSRGLSKIKGMLLGSISNYLIQKSSAPVMVCRRPLRVARTVHRSKTLLNREPRMPLAAAQTEKEATGGVVAQDANEPADISDRIAQLSVGHQPGAAEERDGRDQAAI